METKKCSQCKTDIAKDAKKCPQCHADLRIWFIRHPIITGIGVLVILIIIFSSSGNSNNTNVTDAEVVKNGTNEPISSEKSYQQIFSFSGTGQKKSEPFMIQGDRFKIAYECTGDPSATYCGAFVFKVGSSLPQGVMNATQAVKDETVIYTSMAGKGEYYLDANVLGNFTMTVYDYR